MIWEVLNAPNEEQTEVIRVGLKEDKDRLENNEKLLEDWISCQDHLPKNYDKRILKAYLRGTKHILDNAKRKIEQYFVARTIHSDLLSNRLLTLEEDLLATTFMYSATMPDFTPEGYRITITKLFNSDIEIFNPLKVLRLCAILSELRTHEENFLAGDIIIMDCEFTTPSIATKMIASKLRSMIAIGQEAFPILIKQVHVITNQTVIVKSANFFRQFIKEKIRNRFHVHQNYEMLSKYIPLKCLPSDYGGSQKCLAELNQKWQRILASYGPLFKKIDTVKLEGPIPKHINKNLFCDDLGVEGSFRKLNID